MSNVVALRGHLSRPAQLRTLPSGASLVAFEVTTRGGAARADTVPVVWHDAPASACTLDAGAEVVVVGRVARRFFRAGGATQSRTEVVADAVVSVTSAKRAEAALRRAASTLDGMLERGAARAGRRKPAQPLIDAS